MCDSAWKQYLALLLFETVRACSIPISYIFGAFLTNPRPSSCDSTRSISLSTVSCAFP